MTETPLSCRHAALAALIPEAKPDEVEALDDLLRRAYPNVHPSDLPPDTFRWLVDGAGCPPPPSDVLVAIYDGLSDSRKMDLLEAAKIIKFTG